MCINVKCPIYVREFSPWQWNRRFVCLDKNGDKVYAGDEVKYTPPGQIQRFARSCVCSIAEQKPPRYGYGIVGDNDFFSDTFYPEDIELIKEAQNEH